MININCTINDCVFENDGKCTLTHVSTPSNVYNPECIYFRPKAEIKPKFSHHHYYQNHQFKGFIP